MSGFKSVSELNLRHKHPTVKEVVQNINKSLKNEKKVSDVSKKKKSDVRHPIQPKPNLQKQDVPKASIVSSSTLPSKRQLTGHVKQIALQFDQISIKSNTNTVESPKTARCSDKILKHLDSKSNDYRSSKEESNNAKPKQKSLEENSKNTYEEIKAVVDLNQRIIDPNSNLNENGETAGQISSGQVFCNNFLEAEQNGEIEQYRKTLLNKMDEEIKNMTIDGYEDDNISSTLSTRSSVYDECYEALYYEVSEIRDEQLYGNCDQYVQNKDCRLLQPIHLIDLPSNKTKLELIIEEIISTEKKYILDMEIIIFEYKPKLQEKCSEYAEDILGNIEEIYNSQLEFLQQLISSKENIDQVILTFLNSENLFNLYLNYFKNKINALSAMDVINKEIQEIELQLKDTFVLSVYLNRPLQRLTHYKQFLNNIIKELNYEGEWTEEAQNALDYIRKLLILLNGEVAIASLINCPLQYEEYGIFFMNDMFLMIKPKRLYLSVFLFEKVIVFASEKTQNKFDFWDSIKTEEVNVYSTTGIELKLNQFCPSKKKCINTYILNAKSEKIKNQWEKGIKKILWQQFQAEKEKKKTDKQSSMSIEVQSEGIIIQGCPQNIKDHGIFLQFNNFKVKRTGKKTQKFVVFLFEEYIIFTNEECRTFYYEDSIKLQHLIILPIEKLKNTLYCKDHVKSHSNKKDMVIELHAESASIKAHWKEILNQCLLNQIIKDTTKAQ